MQVRPERAWPREAGLGTTGQARTVEATDRTDSRRAVTTCTRARASRPATRPPTLQVRRATEQGEQTLCGETAVKPSIGSCLVQFDRRIDLLAY